VPTRHIKRTVVLVIGWTLVALGVVGLALPFLQGVLMIVLGLYVLSRESAWAKRRLHELRARHPRVDAMLRRWRSRLDVMLRRKPHAADAEHGRSRDGEDEDRGAAEVSE
jgi:uncharacterized membrane protein YbaN (DUF454 family)